MNYHNICSMIPIIVIAIMIYRWPRRVYIITRYSRFTKNTTIIGVFTSEKKTKVNLDERIQFSIKHMEKEELIELCSHLGIGGMSKRQSKCTMRKLIFQDMLNIEKYSILLQRFGLSYPDDHWPLS